MPSEIKMTEDRLEMSRFFDAPRERVFAAWTEPKLVEQWWGCNQTKSVSSTIDLRVQGTLTHRMDIRGVGECDFVGVFEEIVPGERLVFSTRFGPFEEGGMVHESRITVEFHEEGSGTRMRFVQEGFPAPEICERVSEGFGAAFEKLEKAL